MEKLFSVNSLLPHWSFFFPLLCLLKLLVAALSKSSVYATILGIYSFAWFETQPFSQEDVNKRGLQLSLR